MDSTLKTVGYIYCALSGEYMKVFEGGYIARQGQENPSLKWSIIGAVERNNFGNAVRRYSLAEVLSGKIEWTHKNGAQKVFLLDNDHGGIREWRNGHYVMPEGCSWPGSLPTAMGTARN